MKEEKDIVTIEVVEKEADIVTVEILPEKRSFLEIGISSIQGTRKYQEDTVFGTIEDEHHAIAIICDGMGGLEGGALASQSAVESLARAYFSHQEIESIPEFWRAEAKQADKVVASLTNENGKKLSCGTTVVLSMIEDNHLHWLSVGDSRIYVLRENELVIVNEAHNYRAQLDAMLQNGEITEAEYQKEEYRAEALTSYLGIGNVNMIDVNQNPLELQDQDVVLLCSDGLYRSLEDEEIVQILKRGSLDTVEDTKDPAADTVDIDLQTIAEQLTAIALDKSKGSQDNTSVVILKYNEKEKRL